MILYEIYLGENGLVTKFNKYNEKEIVNLEIMGDKKQIDENTLIKLFKQMINNIQRQNLEN